MKNEEKAKYYLEQANLRREAMREYLWDPEEGQWFDYDIKEEKRKNLVSASNFYPLWAGAAYPDQVCSHVSLNPQY